MFLALEAAFLMPLRAWLIFDFIRCPYSSMDFLTFCENRGDPDDCSDLEGLEDLEGHEGRDHKDRIDPLIMPREVWGKVCVG